MATDKNFVIKNGLTVGTTEVIDSSGNLVNTSGTISGTTITGSDRGTFEDLVLTGDADDDLTFTVSAGDWSILNSQQSNGLIIYDGTAGVQLLYNNQVKLEILDGGIDVENGTLSIAGTEFADNSRNVTAGTISSGDVKIGSGGAASLGEAGLCINTSGKPQLLLDGGGDSDGDIVVPTGETLQVGHWNVSGNSLFLDLSIESDGDVTVERGAINMGSNEVISSSRAISATQVNATAASVFTTINATDITANNLTLLESSGHTTFELGSRSADPLPAATGSYDFKPGMRVIASDGTGGVGVDADDDIIFAWNDDDHNSSSEGYLASTETYATASFSKTFSITSASGARFFAKVKMNDAESGNDPRIAVNGGTEYKLEYADAPNAAAEAVNDTDSWHVVDITDDVVTGTNTFKAWLAAGQKTYIIAVYIFKSSGIMLPNEPYESVAYSHKGFGVGDTRIVSEDRNLINIGSISSGAVVNIYTSSDRGYFVAGTNDASNQHLYLGSYHGTTLKELTFSGSNNAFYPQTSEAIDLGLSTKKFKNLQLSGTISSGAITSSGVTIVDGTNDINLYLANTSYGIQLDYSAGDMFFRTNGGTRLTIANNGNATFSGTINSGAITTSGTISTGSGTNGALALTDLYSPSTGDHLANIGWLQSSGGTYIGYGTKQSGSATWLSTFDNFSGKRNYVSFDEDSVTMVFAAAQQTTVGSAVTGLTERFKFDLNNGVFSVNGSTVIDSSKNLTNIGNLTLSGTVDGRDVAADGTKLDTISTNADVTPSWVPSSDPGYLTSASTQTKYLRSDTSDTFSGGTLTIQAPTDGTGVFITKATDSPDEPAALVIASDADAEDDLAFEIRGNATGSSVDLSTTMSSADTTFAVFANGHTTIGYSSLGTGYTPVNSYGLNVNGTISAVSGYYAGSTQAINSSGVYVGTITSSQVTTALGYTPYQENTALSATSGEFSGDVIVNGNDITMAATNARVKYRVWSNDTYGIGMHNTVTYGGINNDYAMTFQMNNDVDRGFLWFDSDDTLAQGAMALTTDGYLTVANGVRIGYGKTDTTKPGVGIDVQTTADASPAIIATNTGGIGSVIQRWIGSTGSLELGEISSEDYSLLNKEQDNGIVIYNGGGGVDILYNGAAVQSWDSNGGTIVQTGDLAVAGSTSSESAIKTTNGRLTLGPHTSGAGMWLGDSGNATQRAFLGFSNNTAATLRYYVSGNKWTMDASGNSTQTGTASATAFQISGSTIVNSSRQIENVIKATINGTQNSGGQTTLLQLVHQQGGDQGAAMTADIDFHLWDSNTVPNNPQARIGATGDGTANQNYEAGGKLSFYTAARSHPSNTLSKVGEVDHDGNWVFSGNVTAYGSPSDIRLKENIENIQNPLEKVQQLNGVTFNYKKDGKESTGLIAQDLEKVLPQVVYEAYDLETNETHKAVRYGNIVGLLVEAMKEQQKQIEELKEEVSSLRSKN